MEWPQKDLVEAQSFAKRRLTTAFVAGAPGGREVVPHQPMKAIIGGIALSVIARRRFLAFGWFKGACPPSGAMTNSSSASRAVRGMSRSGHPCPVINTTSARLLIPSNRFSVITVDDAKLADRSVVPPGDPGSTGLVDTAGRPDQLRVDFLMHHGERRHSRGEVGRSQAATDRAVVVAADQTWVVTAAMRYPVPAQHVSAVLIALALDREGPVAVPATWLNLFTLGPALQPVQIDGLGKPLQDCRPERASGRCSPWAAPTAPIW